MNSFLQLAPGGIERSKRGHAGKWPTHNCTIREGEPGVNLTPALSAFVLGGGGMGAPALRRAFATRSLPLTPSPPSNAKVHSHPSPASGGDFSLLVICNFDFPHPLRYTLRNSKTRRDQRVAHLRSVGGAAAMVASSSQQRDVFAPPTRRGRETGFRVLQR